ncbi:MAG: hypothetical protein PGN13_16295 [Patulibacter minatonensis]
MKEVRAMALVLLGNINPAGLEEPSVTACLVPEGRSRRQAASEIVDAWVTTHTAGELDDWPEWVEATTDELAGRVAEEFERAQADRLEAAGLDADGAQRPAIGRPDDWQSVGDHWTIENGGPMVDLEG